MFTNLKVREAIESYELLYQEPRALSASNGLNLMTVLNDGTRFRLWQEQKSLNLNG